MKTEKIVCRLYCQYFLLPEEEHVLEFKIERYGQAIRLYKGIHTKADMSLPKYQFITNYLSIESAMTDIFKELRKIEIEAGLYQGLSIGRRLNPVYLETINRFIADIDLLSQIDHYPSFHIYGNRIKFPGQKESWEQWRSYREFLYTIVDTYQNEREVRFGELMNKESGMTCELI